jgi:hypothetical protein
MAYKVYYNKRYYDAFGNFDVFESNRFEIGKNGELILSTICLDEPLVRFDSPTRVITDVVIGPEAWVKIIPIQPEYK